jgi:hypothetical protein
MAERSVCDKTYQSNPELNIKRNSNLYLLDSHIKNFSLKFDPVPSFQELLPIVKKLLVKQIETQDEFLGNLSIPYYKVLSAIYLRGCNECVISLGCLIR